MHHDNSHCIEFAAMYLFLLRFIFLACFLFFLCFNSCEYDMMKLTSLSHLQEPAAPEQEVPTMMGETREKKVGKTHFVEHRTGFHIYHSFHRLWIFLVCMLQVNYLNVSWTTSILHYHHVLMSISALQAWGVIYCCAYYYKILAFQNLRW